MLKVDDDRVLPGVLMSSLLAGLRDVTVDSSMLKILVVLYSN